METRSIMILFGALGIACTVLYYIAAWSFYDAPQAVSRAYTTDGCTFVAEESQSDGVLACCDAHDRAYWQGGSHADRVRVDQEFRACITQESESTYARSIGYAAYGAVRVGGTPYLNVPWRWGYGWKFGRGYR